jgi:hypothetical protein
VGPNSPATLYSNKTESLQWWALIPTGEGGTTLVSTCPPSYHTMASNGAYFKSIIYLVMVAWLRDDGFGGGFCVPSPSQWRVLGGLLGVQGGHASSTSRLQIQKAARRLPCPFTLVLSCLAPPCGLAATRRAEPYHTMPLPCTAYRH